jgi:hypothetical protein
MILPASHRTLLANGSGDKTKLRCLLSQSLDYYPYIIIDDPACDRLTLLFAIHRHDIGSRQR